LLVERNGCRARESAFNEDKLNNASLRDDSIFTLANKPPKTFEIERTGEREGERGGGEGNIYLFKRTVPLYLDWLISVGFVAKINSV
jgi:hypothetical protein